jgi:hypothetical protein
MKIYTGIVFTTTIVALTASCGTSLKVISNYDKNANFQQYKTFAVDTARINERISWLNINRITNAMRADLVKKGFTENISDPDIKVSAAAIIKVKQPVAANTDHNSNGASERPWGWDGGMGVKSYTTYDLQNYKDGSLLIDIADAKTNKLIWEGVGNKQMDEPLKDPGKEIPAIVASVMAGFPPKGK